MTVLFGNLLTGSVSVLNFLLLAITVQKAVERDPKDAKSLIKWSQSLRMLMLFAILAVGVALPYFDTWACIIPMFFVRVALFFRPKFGGMTDENAVQGVEDFDRTGGEAEDGRNAEE
jgi:hypothetical protein